MQREVMWSAWEGSGSEHLRLSVRDDGVVADGLIVGLAAGLPFRARYEVRCDAGWRVRSVRVGEPGSESPGVDLLSDGEGAWTTHSGEAVPGLKGCIDVDISATPFTNTLPIRRLRLAPGESARISVAFVGVGEMRVWAEPQSYLCLEAAPTAGGFYRFEALGNGFSDDPPVDLPVDGDGLVLDYPDLFRRAFPSR